MKFSNLSMFAVAMVVVHGITACTQRAQVEPSVQQFSDVLSDGTQGPLMAVVPAGSGTVGGENFRSFQNEEPRHKVVIDRPYAIGVKEITFAEFDRYCQSVNVDCPDDEGWGRGAQPVINVSWHEANRYVKWLSGQTGRTYRLPSETEWEYAARAGKGSKFWWGDEYQEGMDHCDRTHDQCPAGTDQGKPVPAGHFQANPWGLHDMTSNVSEWIFDCYTPDHSAPSKERASTAVEECPERIMKGASWLNPRPFVHLSARFPVDADARYPSLGFRILRELDANEIQQLTKK